MTVNGIFYLLTINSRRLLSGVSKRHSRQNASPPPKIQLIHSTADFALAIFITSSRARSTLLLRRYNASLTDTTPDRRSLRRAGANEFNEH